MAKKKVDNMAKEKDNQQIEKITFDYVDKVVKKNLSLLRWSILSTSEVSSEEIINKASEIAKENIGEAVTTYFQRFDASTKIARWMQEKYCNDAPSENPTEKVKIKKQGWVNIYHEWVKMEQQANGSWQETRFTRPSSQIFESRESALEAKKYNALKEWEYVDTIRIEWEE